MDNFVSWPYQEITGVVNCFALNFKGQKQLIKKKLSYYNEPGYLCVGGVERHTIWDDRVCRLDCWPIFKQHRL